MISEHYAFEVARQLDELETENAELRAENERLKQSVDYWQALSDRRDHALNEKECEIERLKRGLDDKH